MKGPVLISLILAAFDLSYGQNYCSKGFVSDTPAVWCKIEGPAAGRVDNCPQGFECQRYMDFTEGVCCIKGSVPQPRPSTDNVPGCPAGDALRTGDGTVVNCTGTCPSVVPGPPIHVCARLGTSQRCCPHQNHACNIQQASQGMPCRAGMFGSQPGPRFFFNPTTGQCTQFNYLGCGGNANRFRDAQTCRTFCAGRMAGPKVGACPAGIPAQNPAKSCDLNNPSSCNSGSSCVFSSDQPNAQVCCNGSPQCPAGSDGRPQEAFKVGAAQNARACNPSGGFSCPDGFSCIPSSMNGINVCCKAAQSLDVCPNNAQTNGVQCSVLEDNCGAGFFCHPRENQNTVNGICCGGASALSCPTGNELHRGGNGGKPVICSRGVRSCPAGTLCSPAPTFGGVSVCCSQPAPVAQCPPGFAYSSAGSPVACEMNNPTTCGAGARCLSSTSTSGMGACCIGSGNQGLTCPGGYMQQPTRNFECDLNGGQGCDPGFTCTSAPGGIGGRGVCCVPNNQVGCTNGRNPYADQQGRRRLCTNNPSAAACPGLQGYTCTQSSVSGITVCCEAAPPTPTILDPKKIAVCPRLKVTAIANGAPYKCSRNARRNEPRSCPTGFSCVTVPGTGSVCCSDTTSTDTQVQCADNLPVEMSGSKISCNPRSPGTCNSGQCTLSINVKGYAICCGDQERFDPFDNCEASGTPLIKQGSTQRVTCSSDAQCGSPHYGCKRSVRGNKICCLKTPREMADARRGKK